MIDADRNRPEHLRRPLAEESDSIGADERAAARELLSQRKPPSEVADLVVDAIVNDRFWVFTDDQFTEPIAERHRGIEARTKPDQADTLVDYLLR